MSGRVKAFAVALIFMLTWPSLAEADYQQVGSFGAAGSGNGQFDGPFGVAVAGDGSVYVVDRGNSRVQQFSADGNFINSFGTAGSGDGQFDDPLWIDTDSTGDVYVAERVTRIQRFSSGGTFEAKWGDTFDTGFGELAFPIDVAVDADGNNYVPDLADRVQQFSRDGVPVNEWGVNGDGPGQFAQPFGVGVSSTGVFVADFGNDRIQRFSLFGVYADQWAVASPTLLDANDSIVATFAGNPKEIKLYQHDGAPLGSLPGDNSGASGIGLGTDGKIYVSISEANTVRIYDDVDPTDPTDPTDPGVDTEVLDADVTAKKKQKQSGKRVKVKIKGGAGEAVTGVAKGRIAVKKGKKKRLVVAAKSFKLKKVKKSTEAGEQTVYRLQPKRKKDSKKVLKLLAKGRDLRANPSVKLTDAAGNSVIEKRVVRLK